ncbi:hypothetical protein K456DRAFT_1732072 [Colletotrichum gloeosporioides 23]|nr:hypothetical protein K456DRAFT_1732072 [Colletotrichum gloeosporioides 23]
MSIELQVFRILWKLPTPTAEQLRKVVDAELGTPTLLADHVEPLKLNGALDEVKFFEITVIGREYVDIDLAAWMRVPNSDALLRDLAIIIAQRGFVFFCKQDGMDNELQKELDQGLGELTGKPAASRLHIQPVGNAARELGGDDPPISIVS